MSMHTQIKIQHQKTLKDAINKNIRQQHFVAKNAEIYWTGIVIYNTIRQNNFQHGKLWTSTQINTKQM